MWLDFKFMLHFLEPFPKKQRGNRHCHDDVAPPDRGAAGFQSNSMIDGNPDNKAN